MRLSYSVPVLTLGLFFGIAASAAAVESSAASRVKVPPTSLKFSFSTPFSNGGVLPDAAGKLSGKYSRTGVLISQQVTISLSKLTPSAASDVTALVGAGATTAAVASFNADAKGKYKITFVSKSGTLPRSALPLPDSINPLTNLREIDISSTGVTLLRGDIRAAKLQYQFKGPLDNTGSLAGASASLQLKATEKSSSFGLKAAGLAASGNYLLQINGKTVQMVAADAKGKLNIKTLPSGAPVVLDIHAVALADSTSGVVILSVIGLGIPPDTIGPVVTSTTPINGTSNVPTNVKLSALFNKAVNPATITTANFTLTDAASTSIAGTLTYDSAMNRSNFQPTAALAINTVFTANLAAGVQDLSGNPTTAATTWTFTTGASADATAPFVVSTNPADAAVNVSINRPISATFNKTMDATTFTSTSFTLRAGTTAVSGVVSASGTSATFSPSANLAINTLFTGTIATTVTDLAGNELASTFTWSFTTGSSSAAGPAPIPLGSTNTYAVLAGSTVTSAGATQVNADLGVSPGSAVTGFPPGIVTGAIHAGDGAAAQAKNDLLAAYNDGAARLGAAVLPGNLGGLTFTPGLYKNSTSTMISGTGSGGILTLDAQGDANAVFIFQMGSTLTTDPGTQIVLSGSAKAANVYWQVGTSATLGTTSIFKGNILADQSITLTTGATLEGRALTRIGAVVLDGNTITSPAP